MSARRRLALAALAVLAACDIGVGSEPSISPCLVGHVRTEHGCRVPEAAIVVDGTTSDWASIAEIPLAATCARAPCDGLVPTAIRVAVECTTSDACTVALWIRGPVPSALDATTRLVLELASTPERPTAEVNRLVVEASGTSFWKNGHRVDDVAQPYRIANVEDGYEVAIPTGYLALRGAARIRAFAERSTEDASWTPITDAAPVRACWLSYPFEEQAARARTVEPCDEFAARGAP